MKKSATIVNLCFWLVATVASGVVFALSRSSQTTATLFALSIPGAPCIACGIGALLGSIFVLACNVSIRKWPSRGLRLLELLLVIWFAIAFLSVPAIQAGVPLPLFTLSVTFHSFPFFFVLLGFACGVACAPVEFHASKHRSFLTSPFSSEDVPRRNAWHASKESFEEKEESESKTHDN